MDTYLCYLSVYLTVCLSVCVPVDYRRIQSVCRKMAELQKCCKQAGIGLPLSQVLAGTGLYGGAAGASAGAGAGGDAGRGGPRGAASGGVIAGEGGGEGARRRRPPASGGEREAGAAEELRASLGGAGVEEESWKHALINELWRVGAVCLCALVFTVLLQYFRGEDPLGGRGMGGSAEDGAGQDEL